MLPIASLISSRVSVLLDHVAPLISVNAATISVSVGPSYDANDVSHSVCMLAFIVALKSVVENDVTVTVSHATSRDAFNIVPKSPSCVRNCSLLCVTVSVPLSLILPLVLS